MTTAGTNDSSTLLDEAAVRDAIVRFADAATHADYDAFRSLWADDAAWVMGGAEGQPFERSAQGADEIVTLFRQLRNERDYFIQLVVPGAIEVDGDVATSDPCATRPPRTGRELLPEQWQLVRSSPPHRSGLGVHEPGLPVPVA